MQKSFKEVWFSEETIQKVKKLNPKHFCHHHCVYDDRNELLNHYYSLDENQINFI